MDVFISCALCMTMDRVRCVCGRISYCRDEDVFCHSVIMSQGYNVAGMKLGCRVNSCVQCCVCASVLSASASWMCDMIVNIYFI